MLLSWGGKARKKAGKYAIILSKILEFLYRHNTFAPSLVIYKGGLISQNALKTWR